MTHTTALRHLLAFALAAIAVAGCAAGPSTVTPTAMSPGLSASGSQAPTGSTAPGPSLAASPSASPATAPLIPPIVPSPPPFTPDLASRLATTVLRLRATEHLPGVQVAIRYSGGWGWREHAGLADLARRRPVTPTTAFDAGSITKTFMAALVLQLADEGLLRLDDPVSTWLPEAKVPAGATIRQLLDHTSGIDDPFDHVALLSALEAHPRTAWSPARVLGFAGKPRFAPGKGWAYANSGYLLLGQIVERATQWTVSSQIRLRFLEPLGLDHTFLQTEEQVNGPVARGYDFTGARNWAVASRSDGSRYLPFTSLATALGTSGAMVSTADDLARWAEALYGGHVLSPTALAEMLDVSPTVSLKPRWPYGLGMQAVTLRGRPSVGHSGLLSGYRASMRYFPGDGLTIVVLTNVNGADPDTIVSALLDDLYPPNEAPTRPIGQTRSPR